MSNNGYTPGGPVTISADFTECTLKIANVSGQEHFGKWTCFLSKTNGNQDLWREMTNYNVKLFAPMKLQITVSSYKLNNMEDDVNDKNLVREIFTLQSIKFGVQKFYRPYYQCV